MFSVLLERWKQFWPVAVVAGFGAGLGMTKLAFSIQLALVTVFQNKVVGPYPLVIVSMMDGLIGLLVFISSASLIWRRTWGLTWIRRGWMPVIAYELGKAVSDLAAHPIAFDWQVGMEKLLMFLGLVLVGLCMTSRRLDDFVGQ